MGFLATIDAISGDHCKERLESMLGPRGVMEFAIIPLNRGGLQEA